MTPVYEQSPELSSRLLNNSSCDRTLFDASTTPSELWALRQWVCWRYGQPRPNGKRPKQPISPATLRNARINAPTTWAGINQAVAAYHKTDWLAGIGFVLAENDGYTMIDLDDCLIDGALTPIADEIVSRLHTYTEISPSGRGLRLIVRCADQPTLITTGLEVYSSGRYATMTGCVLVDEPIATVNLDWLIDCTAKCAEHVCVEPVTPANRPDPSGEPPANANDYEKAVYYLSRLHPSCADAYHTWIKVGMALRELGDVGLTLWDGWSQRSAKYDPGCCERTWKQMRPGATSLRSLFYWGKHDQAMLSVGYKQKSRS